MGASTKKKKSKSRSAKVANAPKAANAATSTRATKAAKAGVAETVEPSVSKDTARGTLKWASWLIFSECVALAMVLVYLVYADASQDRATTKSALLVTLYAAIFVAVLALVARGLRNRKQWARGPAVALHLMLVPLGWYMIVGGLVAVGVTMVALGIGGFVLLLLPSTRAELNIK